LVGTLDDLLRLCNLTDALLRRSADLPVRSVASQEGHAATESELPREPSARLVHEYTVRRMNIHTR
jgi:hypothetical protein